MKIILLGYMASGKSTIGKYVAKKLKYRFIDLDTYIEEQENNSVSTIFKLKGEIYFRRIEHTYLQKLLNTDTNFVLSLGGGTPCYGNNMELINKADVSAFYLNTPINILVSRLIKAKSSRPLISELADDKITEFVAKHLFERRFFYEQATFLIKTADKTTDTIVNEICELLN